MRESQGIGLGIEEIELLATRCAPIKKNVLPPLRELQRLEAKGFMKDGNDLLMIRKLREVISEELNHIMENAQKDFLCALMSPPERDPSKPTTTILEDFHLDILDTDGHSFAVADTDMFFTQWSPDFIHGSDSMLHITALAERILAKGEQLTKLESVSWKRPMQNNLKLAVYAQEFPVLADRDKYLLEARFQTSAGRKLTVLGMDNPESPIKRRATNNPFAEHTLCRCPDCHVIREDGTQSFQICEPRVPGCYQEFAKSQPLSVATMIEMLTIALVSATAENGQSDRQVLRVLGGLRDLPIPQELKPIFNPNATLEVRFLEEQKKRGKSGMTLTPFQFKFPHQESFSSGIAASTDSTELASGYCR